MFNEQAKAWDTERRAERAKVIGGEILKALPNKPGLVGVEFGCGTGLISFALRERFSRITLVDSSPGMIDVAKQKVVEQSAENMVTLLADSLPASLQADVIFTSMAVHHVKDLEAIACSFYEALAEGGVLVIVDLDEDDGSFHADFPDFDGYNGFDQKKLGDLLGEVGFVDVESRTFYHDEKMVGEKVVPYSLFVMKGIK